MKISDKIANEMLILIA